MSREQGRQKIPEYGHQCYYIARTRDERVILLTSADRLDRKYGATDARFVEKDGRTPSPSSPERNTPKIMGKAPISTHVLDVTLGKPAKQIKIKLEYKTVETDDDGPMMYVCTAETNQDGRAILLPIGEQVKPGDYCITFETGSYLRDVHVQDIPFYPKASIYFTIRPDQVNDNFHIPLLLSPYSYSTYRGS